MKKKNIKVILKVIFLVFLYLSVLVIPSSLLIRESPYSVFTNVLIHDQTSDFARNGYYCYLVA